MAALKMKASSIQVQIFIPKDNFSSLKVCGEHLVILSIMTTAQQLVYPWIPLKHARSRGSSLSYGKAIEQNQ
jgi:hypothetical protein